MSEDRRAIDEDFKEWMKTSVRDMHTDIKDVREIAQKNTDDLARYMWFWRMLRYVAGGLLAFAAANWESLAKMLTKH